MNIYNNKIPVFNNSQMQYGPIMLQNIPIVIKYVYSLNFGSVLKCCSEATPCSKGLTSYSVVKNVSSFYNLKSSN